jgi:pimeloyl-[acyl-carrier protein] methyl ester esterase
VLLHGWAMHSGIWGSVRDSLAQQFRLHLVDLPGHGLSPASEPGTLESSGRDRCGDSAGKLHARRLVAGRAGCDGIGIVREPERIEKLILISTTPCFAKRERLEFGMEHKLLQLFLENLKLNYATTINRFLTLQMSGDRDASKILPQLRKTFFSAPNRIRMHCWKKD